MCVWCDGITCWLFYKYKDVEAVNYLFEFLNKYACCVLLYLHNQLMFNSYIILLHSVGECDNASMSIMISLVYSKFVTGCVMLF